MSKKTKQLNNEYLELVDQALKPEIFNNRRKHEKIVARLKKIGKQCQESYTRDRINFFNNEWWKLSSEGILR